MEQWFALSPHRKKVVWGAGKAVIENEWMDIYKIISVERSNMKLNAKQLLIKACFVTLKNLFSAFRVWLIWFYPV